LIRGIRGRGLLTGIEIDPARIKGKTVAERLAANGILTKETHETIIRLAPPLIITEPEIDRAVELVADTFEELERRPRRKAGLAKIG
jgi:ornithine--oxo-acid transaminase